MASFKSSNRCCNIRNTIRYSSYLPCLEWVKVNLTFSVRLCIGGVGYLIPWWIKYALHQYQDASLNGSEELLYPCHSWHRNWDNTSCRQLQSIQDHVPSKLHTNLGEKVRRFWSANIGENCCPNKEWNWLPLTGLNDELDGSNTYHFPK